MFWIDKTIFVQIKLSNFVSNFLHYEILLVQGLDRDGESPKVVLTGVVELEVELVTAPGNVPDLHVVDGELVPEHVPPHVQPSAPFLGSYVADYH